MVPFWLQSCYFRHVNFQIRGGDEWISLSQVKDVPCSAREGGKEGSGEQTQDADSTAFPSKFCAAISWKFHYCLRGAPLLEKMIATLDSFTSTQIRC